MSSPHTDSEKQRLAIAYEEERALHRAIDYVKNRLAEERMREREMQWRIKESELHDREAAMLNAFDDVQALEQQLAEQRGIFDCTVASMDEGFILADSAFRIVRINAAATTLLGIHENAALGNDVRGVVALLKDETPLENNEHPVARAHASEKPVLISHKDAVWCRTAHEKNFPVALTATPCTAQGKTIGVVLVFRDAREEN